MAREIAGAGLLFLSLQLVHQIDGVEEAHGFPWWMAATEVAPEIRTG